MNNNLVGDEVGKLFVGGLDWSTTQETLRNYFSQYGEVVDCVIMKDKTTNQSRGFGFVKFKDPNCVRTVLETKPHNLDGRNIDPKPCTPRGMQPEKSRTKEGWVEVKKAEPRDSKAPGQLCPGQWAPRGILSAANGWTAQPAQGWQQPYGAQGVWVSTTGQPIDLFCIGAGGYGPQLTASRGTPTQPPSPFNAFLVTSPAGGFAAPQGYPQQGYSTAPQFGYSFGTPQADQYAAQVPPPPTTPGAAPLGFAPATTPTQDLSKAPTGQPDFPYSQYGLGNYLQDPSAYGPTRPSHSYGQDEQRGCSAGYGQELTAFSHAFADPSQPTASYGAPTAQPAAGPQPAATAFGRGQNHNVQGFHPYRR
ncbi:DAZ-associated protein 1 isoform X9 [Gasterosteus aculeatus]